MTTQGPQASGNESSDASGIVCVPACGIERTRLLLPAEDDASGERNRLVEHSALARLHGISSRLASSDDLSTLLQEVVDTAIAVSGADMGYMQLADEASPLRRIAAHRGLRQDFLDQIAAIRESPSAWTETLQRHKRVIVEDISKSTLLRGTAWMPVLEAAGVRAIQATPMLARDGRVLGVYVTHWTVPHSPDNTTLLILDLLARHAADLIEYRQREQALQEAVRRKDEFLAMLGHELRNPLTPIALILGSIKRRGKDPFQKEHESIERQVRHLMRLVDDLLDVTRIARGSFLIKKRPMALKNAVAQALQIAMPLIEKRRHRLDVRIPRIHLNADEERLTQLVANLLTNAARYTLPGGRIVVQAWRKSGEIVIKVQDDGIGMAAEFLPKAFKLFTQAGPSADTMTGGLGLGLAIVSHIVALHGGTIEAASEGLGKGSLFTVRLPVMDGDKPAGKTMPAPVLAMESRRILVVDNNEDVLEWLPALLRKVGHSVATARDGPGALQIAKTFSPEIAVLDLGLPDMDGYEIATRLRHALGEATPQLIALSGYGQDSDRDRCKAEGFVAHVTKPNLDGLLQAIDICVATRQQA